MQEVLATIGTATFWISAPFVLAGIRVVWTLFGLLTERAVFWLSLRTYEIELFLNAKEGVPETIASLNVVFVRYGNDEYLRGLASDQERYHGRLQNKVIHIASPPFQEGDPIKVKMRVHRRLGTQFKLFVDVVGDPTTTVDYLESHETISGVDAVERPRLSRDDASRYRVFFLLDRLPIVETVEKYKNNYIPPV